MREYKLDQITSDQDPFDRYGLVVPSGDIKSARRRIAGVGRKRFDTPIELKVHPVRQSVSSVIADDDWEEKELTWQDVLRLYRRKIERLQKASEDQAPSLQEILLRVCWFHGMKVDTATSKGSLRHITLARGHFCTFARKHGPKRYSKGRNSCSFELIGLEIDRPATSARASLHSFEGERKQRRAAKSDETRKSMLSYIGPELVEG